MDEMTAAALRSWIARWDRQQEFYLPDREARYDAMLTVLRHLVAANALGPRLRVLDLGCGTGSIGQRLLAAFPSASYVGLDADAALLTLATVVEADAPGRCSVFQRDLALETWPEGLSDGEFDAVVSSTALHWLDREQIERIAAECFRLLKPGGVFLDADNLAYASGFWQGISDAIEREHQAAATAEGREDWAAWWSALREEPSIAPFVAERDRRFPPREDDGTDNPPPPLTDYVAALKRAGFTDIDILWQRMDDRLLAARRPLPAPDVRPAAGNQPQ